MENDLTPKIKKVTMKISPSFQFKPGDFIVYYDLVVKANVLVNVQDYYWTHSLFDKDKLLKYKRWIYYKAFNLENGFVYYDGSKLGIIFEEYTSVRYALPEEISRYLKALKKEGLSL